MIVLPEHRRLIEGWTAFEATAQFADEAERQARGAAEAGQRLRRSIVSLESARGAMWVPAT